MFSIHMMSGIFVLGVVVGFLSSRYMRTPAAGRFPVYGWVGMGIVLAAEIGLFAGVGWVATFFTPIAWTGYLVLADAAVKRLQGSSRMSSPAGGFLSLALWSIPLWLIFEAYNLRLKNWTYVGVPANPLLAALGYGWSFATIWPAIFETADLFQAMDFFQSESHQETRVPPWMRNVLVFAGLLFVGLPILLPAPAGRYLFAFVWVGFILLLDPLNYAWGGRSLLRDWEAGKSAAFGCFLISGLVCGLLWEFWNYWAGARWEYIFPIAQGWKIFAMPLPGFLGFAPFGLECLVMYEFLRTVGLKVHPASEKDAGIAQKASH
jgi:hypothetical protein